MPRRTKEPSPERAKTDEGLRGERERTDRALSERHDELAGDAAEVLDRARADADDVVRATRVEADRARRAGPSSDRERHAIDHARARADEVLREERAVADETLLRAREESQRALARLLPLEREKTDRYLLTERTRSDDALEHRDDFLAIVSHDLRNLLGGIVLGTSVLAEAAPGTATETTTLATTARIQRYAARMNRLIGDLLDVASIDAGRLSVAPAPGDAAALVDEAVATFQTPASAKGVSLDAVIEGRPILARFDHDRMLQVLANLIGNAIKFTAAGGEVRVGAARVGSDLCLTVRDTGIGIPAAALGQVFQRFWQVGEDDRRGFGLGLYISRCIVEAHGGTVRAESVEGRGSTFVVTLAGAAG